MLKKYFTTLVQQTNKIGLEINKKNTKFMIVSSQAYNENEYVILGTYNHEIVKDMIWYKRNK